MNFNIIFPFRSRSSKWYLPSSAQTTTLRWF